MPTIYDAKMRYLREQDGWTMDGLEPQQIISVMRALLNNQVVFSWMPRDVLRYIFANELIRHYTRPKWYMALTSKGYAFIGEFSPESDNGF